MTGRARVGVGDRIAFQERAWNVVMLDGARVQLADDEGSVVSVSLPHLLASPDFAVEGQAAPPAVGPLGLLDSLPEEVREAALEWEGHVREVETGQPRGAGPALEVYDPSRHSMAERESAKAQELTTAGQRTSVATVRRMRARYRKQGVWGLVDHRATRGRSPLGRADERVVETTRAVLESNVDRSTGALSRLRTQVGWELEERFGQGTVKLPPPSTFNRLARALATPRGLLESARRRKNRSSRPQPPFTPTVALRPGEVVMVDSTPLDVLTVFDDGVVGRCELTIALDVATRSIVAAVLRPVGTSAVDVAVLLAQMATPMPMRRGWKRALAMSRSLVPYERLVSLDERMKNAAARPVIMPETIVVDQGTVFISTAFLAACESLGVSLQPVPPANGPAKGAVERTFRSIHSLFTQYVAGYTGANVTHRGSRVQAEACWSPAQLQELLDEWIVACWQHRPHKSLRHPLMTRRKVSPNQMWAALVGVAGYVPVPLSGQDFLELMPVRWQAITDAGIQFDYRTYDDAVLNNHRGQRSPQTGGGGKWEVHYNPYDVTRVWVRLPEDGLVEVPWIHATEVAGPFSNFIWEHLRSVIPRTRDRDEHELELARAVNALLKRASAGHGTPRERRVVARATATDQLAQFPVPPAGLDVLAAPSLTLLDTPDEQPEDADDLPDEDDELLSTLSEDDADEDEGVEEPAMPAQPSRRRGATILNDAHSGLDQWL